MPRPRWALPYRGDAVQDLKVAVKKDQSPVYAFGEFRLGARQRILWRKDERVALTPKAVDVLLLLVERAGRVVTRDELLRAIWADSHVEEANLTQTVFVLRKALGRTSGEPYIATVSGQGYRFVAEVRLVADGTAQAEPTRARRAWAIPAVIVVAVSIALGVAILRWKAPPAGHAADERVMFAVLPFDNLTGDVAQEYFSDGLTEEMISQIGKLDHRKLGVIARTSVMRYKGTRTPLDTIGSDLGVQYVLEGSVRRDATKVRVTAQLIRVEDQSHLWSHDYDRDLRGLLALERDIAQDIAAEVRLSLDQAVPSDLTQDQLEAHDAYLKGRYFWNMRTLEGFEEAIKQFDLAIAVDPGHARAWAGLADCYALLPGYEGVSPSKYLEKARMSARRALELEDRLAEAHTSLALITEDFDWDLAAAEREYLRAIELNPNYATAHHWYGELLTWQGRFEEALIESERARRLDPLSLIIAADSAMILFYSRQYDRAAQKLEAVLEHEPAFPGAHKVRQVYVEQGRFEEALADVQSYSSNLSDLGFVLGRAGRVQEARLALEQLKRLHEQRPVDPVSVARVYVATGDREQALTWLERAREQRSSAMLALKVDPAWDRLHDEPRFQALLRAVRLDD
jgi:TolB-like protein/DNA-binding winged helix-turn-helix (wHTH) protein/Tfp pilus assembly protein PilF